MHAPDPSVTPVAHRHRHRRPPIVVARFLAAALGAPFLVAACGTATTPVPSPSGTATAIRPAGTAASAASPSAAPTPTPAPTASPTPAPTPTPVPTPALVEAPLTGRLVTPALAARHPIAVMVDDHWDARPQSGFTEASVVWQAPAEGGIPRYMLVFAEGSPTSVGPVRSARVYFVQWASEWNAVYVHVGGSPQAMALLRAKGRGQLVYDADEFRWGGIYLWRSTDRFAPHNVYTDAKHLRAMGARVGAGPVSAEPAWSFGDDAPLDLRPKGARIDVGYQYGKIGYRYDRASNTWRRYVDGKVQRDRATDKVVAPRNVVVMQVAFGDLGPGQKGRLEAANVGTGRAWIATNGTTIRGSWRKDSVADPTRFYDAAGRPVTLTRGQTFVQVIPPGMALKFVDGTRIFDAGEAAERGIR